MTILVVGSTGTLGFLAVEAVRAAGHAVVAMVRDRQSPAAVRLRAVGARLCVIAKLSGGRIVKGRLPILRSRFDEKTN